MPDGLQDQIEKEMSAAPETTEPTRDAFKEDWEEALAFWKRIHPIYDYAWLFYNSMVFMSNLYGEKWLEVFGMQVAVPRTFMTVESIASQMLNRKIEFDVSGRNFNSYEKAEYEQQILNSEWGRAQADKVIRESDKDALIYGNGYILSVFVDEKTDFHMLPQEDEGQAPDDPEDGVEDVESIKTVGELQWMQESITEYKGMKCRRLDPYYTFTDPYATCDEDRRFVYFYGSMDVDQMREFVVKKGWLTEEDAKKRIQPTTVERFDNIRNQLDSLYSSPITPYTRGDHQGSQVAPAQQSELQNRNRCAYIERYEKDHYEIRLVGDDVTLYKDFNIYPHKKIPITTIWDVKVPGEFRGRGEPEIIRYQQVEENKIHNFLLQAALISIVQRYAIVPSLLEDETDANFNNPFKPLRLKALPGNSVEKAIMPMQQPDLKSGPFKLMDLVKEVVQQTTGATDFVISSSNATTDTATESENLVQASAARIRTKLVNLEESLEQIAQMWIACFVAFYDEEADLKITGKNVYYRYIPYDKAKVNEDQEFIQKTADAHGAAPQTTLRSFYQALGYKDVIFASELIGQYDVKVKISDIEINADRMVDKYLKAIKVMAEANAAAAASGESKRFDVFKLSEDMIRQFPFIENVEEYIIGGKPEASLPIPEPAPMEGEQVEVQPEQGMAPAMAQESPI